MYGGSLDITPTVPLSLTLFLFRFDIVSDLTAKGLISKLEGTAVIGYPGPMTCILDKTGSVRHVTEVSSIIGNTCYGLFRKI